MANGDFQGAKVHSLGLAEDGVGYVYDPDKISDEVKAIVDDYAAKIKSGELVIRPATTSFLPLRGLK